MFKTIILLCHFLGITIAGHRDYFHQVPYITRSDNVRTFHYTNTEPVTMSYSSAIRPSLYKKSFYYFSSPDEHFDYRQNQLMSRRIFVNSADQKPYENRVLNLANNEIEKEQQQHQQQQVHVFNKQPNINSLLQNLQTAQLVVDSGSQQQTPEVHYINYDTDDEAEQVIQQVISAYGMEIPNDGRVSHARVQAIAAPPVMNQLRKPAVSYINNNVHSSLPVHKNYAMNYLPTGVDVVPGSSYIPLRRI